MQLRTYLADNKISPEAFAQRLTDRGLPTSVHGVTKWLYGQRTPRPDALRAIHEATGGAVGANDFLGITETEDSAA